MAFSNNDFLPPTKNKLTNIKPVDLQKSVYGLNGWKFGVHASL